MFSQKGDASPAVDSGSPERVTDPRADEAIIPAGALDPVYEAKAKVLNRAVCAQRHPASPARVPPIQVAVRCP